MRHSVKAMMMLLVCVLAGSSHTALADPSHPSFASLELNVADPEGSWVTGEGDTWFASTTETTSDSFTLLITNTNGESADCLHLLVASNIIDDRNFSISINGVKVDIPNEIQVLSFYNLAYIQIGKDGIYSTYYWDENLGEGIGEFGSGDEIVTVNVEIELYPPYPKI